MIETPEGRIVRTTEVETVAGHGDAMDMVCPRCKDYLNILRTSYGWRAVCRRDRVRWTHINDDSGVYAEPWSPMNERERLTGLPNKFSDISRTPGSSPVDWSGRGA